MKRLVILLTVVIGWAMWAGFVHAETRLRIVTTLSTFADLVEQIGGEQVDVSSIAPPRFNPHFIEPRPSDVLTVKRADLFVHAGLDLEMWRYPLVDAAGNVEARPGGSRELDLSSGLQLLEVPERQPTRAQGDIHIYGNPHYWLLPENVRIMARAIAEKLSELDPMRAEHYQRNLDDFLQRLDAQTATWRQETTSIRDHEMVAYHNAWPYVEEFLGIRIEHFLEPKPGIPPTPGQVGFLEGYIQAHRIPVIIQPSYQPSGATKKLAQQTGAQVITLCQNVRELEACGDYLSMMDYNVQQLVGALSP